MKPRLVWSPALQCWCCTDVNFRACAPMARDAWALWASEIAIRILLTKLENDHVPATTH